MKNFNYLVFTPINFYSQRIKNNIFATSDDAFENFKNYQNTYNKVELLNHRWSDQKKISKELKYLYQLNKKFIENLYKNSI